MNLRKLIVEECANWLKDGCIAREGDSCLALQKKRCTYFERCIEPGISMYPAWLNGVNEYHAAIGRMSRPVNIRTCSCGEPLARRKRFCLVCQKKRRRENTRKYVNAFREKSKSLDVSS